MNIYLLHIVLFLITFTTVAQVLIVQSIWLYISWKEHFLCFLLTFTQCYLHLICYIAVSLADTCAPRVHNNVEKHEKIFAHKYIKFGPKDLTTSIISIMNVLINVHWPIDNNSERLVTSDCHQLTSSFLVNQFSFL